MLFFIWYLIKIKEMFGKCLIYVRFSCSIVFEISGDLIKSNIEKEVVFSK